MVFPPFRLPWLQSSETGNIGGGGGGDRFDAGFILHIKEEISCGLLTNIWVSIAVCLPRSPKVQVV